MADLSQVKEHMEIVGSDGAHIGTVDKIEGNRIKLTKRDSSQEQHRYVDGSSVATIDGNKVRLSKKGNEALH
ncbi:MAG: DUF2171 domain-containing protein [Alphaproteobacteria bacterium]|nr:DUF2171 domain-containing protein [Alphaproteobacteria bacterium]